MNVFAAAAAAYSVRIPAGSTYSGPLIRVRRSSDNAEQDIYATSLPDSNGNRWLDTTALLAFVGTPQYPLDAISVSAAAAYSLRKVRSAYTGNCIRVRRSSDNAELDIGFTSSGVLDQTALLAFTGANSGFVTTWYDQSGNSKNATQATAANQPRLVNAGVVDTLNGKPMLSAISAQTLLVPVLSGLTSAAISVTYAQGTTNNITAPFQFNPGANVDHLPYSDGNAYTGFFSATRPNLGAYTATANTPLIATANQNGSTLSLFRNGSTVGSSSQAFTTPTTRQLFNGLGLSGSCYLAEAIILSSSILSADRTLLEQSQAVFYGIAYYSTIPSAFVTTWYDQSGNARHATNTTATDQGRIVNAGVYGGEIDFAASGSANRGRLFFPATLNVGAFPYTTNAVMRQTAASPSILLGNGAIQFFRIDGLTAAYFVPGLGYGSYFNASVPVVVTQTMQSATAATGWANGTNVGSTTNTSATGVIVDGIGVWGGPQSFFAAREMLIFPSALTAATRQTLERSQGAAFNITVA